MIDYTKKQVVNKFNTLEVKEIQRFIKPESTKLEIMESICEGAKTAYERQAGTLKIYYSGHGIKGSGNWECKKPDIMYDAETKHEH